MASVESGHNVCKNGRVLATGGCNRDALARSKHLVFFNRFMHLFFESVVEAFSAQLHCSVRVRSSNALRKYNATAAVEQTVYILDTSYLRAVLWPPKHCPRLLTSAAHTRSHCRNRLRQERLCNSCYKSLNFEGIYVKLMVYVMIE